MKTIVSWLVVVIVIVLAAHEARSEAAKQVSVSRRAELQRITERYAVAMFHTGRINSVISDAKRCAEQTLGDTPEEKDER